MNNRALLSALFLTFVSAAPGCGDEADPVATSEDLTQAAKKLIGAYADAGEASLGIRGLVLTSEVASSNGNRFFADIETGIVCAKAPCPSLERVEGTFTGGTKTITFKSTTASAAVQALLGKFNYTMEGSTFTLSRKGAKQALEARESYCGEDPQSECGRQDLRAPRCLGSWSCSEEQTCAFVCPGSGGSCSGGTVTDGQDEFVPSADGMECATPTTHCLTEDHQACPQISPLPPGFCADGKVVNGQKFVSAADGMECALPTAHCVTEDLSACPLVSPKPPGFCKGGTVVKGASKFFPSTDGMECEQASVHCVTNDAQACPQL